MLITVINWRHYFATPYHEQGDAAVNALQIDQAGHLGEIYGNYSRFHFHHPGPAFFYVYAAAERQLCDVISTGIPPHMAHQLAGLALQSAFFALAVTLAASWITAPLFPGLCLVAAALHFGAIGGAFTSIWPPHVLLMPFLAFWVACVSVGSGRGRHLPWLALSGSFLVHGHVAQPLFVLALSFLAYAGLAWHLRRSGDAPLSPWRAFRRAHLWSLGIVLTFLLPLVLDLAKGRESNFAQILRLLGNHSYGHKTLGQALLYFLSFFAYLRHQDVLLASTSPADLSFLRDHLWIYSAWLTAGVASLTVLARVLGSVRRETRRMLWIMEVFWLATAGLCLRWGVMQTGPMYDFNGYFYYAVIFGLLMIFCGLLAEVLPWRKSRWPGTVLIASAAVLGAFRLRPSPVPANDQGVAIRNATVALLRADPHPNAPKMLVFSHDDWPVVASAALALERAGVTFYVEGAWRFMFERRHVLPESLLYDPRANLSVWRFVHATNPRQGAAFVDNLRVVFQPTALSPDRGVVDFSRTGNLPDYTLYGFSTPDGNAVWTNQPRAALQFRPLPATHDVMVSLEASPFLAVRKRDGIDEQPVSVFFDGVRVATRRVTSAGVVHCLIPKDLWNRTPTALLTFDLPNARSPLELGFSEDPRKLSLLVTRLTARPASSS